MNEATLIAIAAVVFVWAIVSEHLAARNITGPLVFLVAGLLLGNPSWGIVSVDIDSSTVHSLAELTLALLLFADASAVPLRAARQDLPLTVRLLAVALPLSIALGTGLALLVFPSLPVAMAGLIAASLAPTDAALSASVIADDRLPSQVRRVLNVESGLNDGIATPVVLAFIAASASAIGVAGHHDDVAGALGQLAVGVVVGTGLGLAGGWLVGLGHQQGWMQHGARRLAVVALALLAFLVASEVGGNPFVAAFIGGLAFGSVPRAVAAESVEATELAGSLLSLVLWFVFGAAFVLPAFEDLEARVVLYAVLSLTVIRMGPVAIALIGAGTTRSTTTFLGWFGPRGLASVVFALLALEELGEGDPRVVTVLRTIAVTIVLSVAAHGVSGRPFTARYLRALRRSSATRADDPG